MDKNVKQYMLIPKGVHCKSSSIYFVLDKACAACSQHGQNMAPFAQSYPELRVFLSPERGLGLGMCYSSPFIHGCNMAHVNIASF